MDSPPPEHGRRPTRQAAEGWLLTFALFSALATKPALAVPSFAIQTGQPCAACHVGAFGPQLKPYGRDFKLHGYVANDGQDHGPPLAATAMTSFTHTNAPQVGGAAPGFRPNDNFAVDELSLYYAGKVTANTGAFVELNYDAVERQARLGKVDIRHAKEGQVFEKDLLWGFTANNSPTVQDAWNSTPAWGFPYNASALAPTPVAAALIDGKLSQRVAGTSAYMLWNDLLYAEAAVYQGLSPSTLRITGIVPVEGTDLIKGMIPYWRFGLIKDLEQHHFQVGTYGLIANVIPGGNPSTGFADRFTDIAFDANYQFIVNPKTTVSDMLSVHATWIHEVGRMDASQALTGSLPNHSLDTMRVDMSYSFAATVTPSVQYFRTSGTRDPNYWDTLNGIPNSEGMIYEIAYVPWGKPDSPYPGFNARLALQYVDYLRFDGSRVDARRNNSIYLSLWTGVKF